VRAVPPDTIAWPGSSVGGTVQPEQTPAPPPDPATTSSTASEHYCPSLEPALGGLLETLIYTHHLFSKIRIHFESAAGGALGHLIQANYLFATMSHYPFFSIRFYYLIITTDSNITAEELLKPPTPSAVLYMSRCLFSVQQTYISHVTVRFVGSSPATIYDRKQQVVRTQATIKILNQ
jgi:hypothetical protein